GAGNPPVGLDALYQRLGRLGIQPLSARERRSLQRGTPLLDQRRQPFARRPLTEPRRLVREQLPHHRQIMIVTEIIGQALEVSAPTFEVLRPARREQLAVIPLVLHALAPFVQIFGIRGALRTGEIPAPLAIAAFQPPFQESEALAFERPFACSPG